MTDLTATQIMLIGLLATIIAGALNLYLKRQGKAPGRRWITLGLYVIAVLLAAFWARPLLPPFPAFPAPVDDPAGMAALAILYLGALVVWLGKLIAAASSIVGFATLIYNTLLKAVLDKLGWGAPPVETTPGG